MNYIFRIPPRCSEERRKYLDKRKREGRYLSYLDDICQWHCSINVGVNVRLIVAKYNIILAENGKYVPKHILRILRRLCDDSNDYALIKRYDKILDEIDILDNYQEHLLKLNLKQLQNEFYNKNKFKITPPSQKFAKNKKEWEAEQKKYV